MPEKQKHVEIQKLLLNVYKISVQTIKELYSFEDSNYYLRVKSGKDSLDGLDEYILKIINRKMSKNADLYNQITSALQQLCDQGYCVSQPIPNIQGNLYSSEIIFDTESFSKNRQIVFLLKFLPGRPLIDVKPKELPKENFLDIVQTTGRNVAQIVTHLTNYCNLDKSVLAHELNAWKIENLNLACEKRRLDQLSDKTLLQIIDHVLLTFNSRMVPLLPSLRNGIINNDVNGGNIIIEKNSGCNSSKLKYRGLIDFGELCTSKCVFELATLQAFMMISAKHRGIDMNLTAERALKGFEEVMTLNEEERSCLNLAVRCRLSILICSCAVAINANKAESKEKISFLFSYAVEILKTLYNRESVQG